MGGSGSPVPVPGRARRTLRRFWAAFYRGWVPWCLVVAHMALIYFFSSRTGDELNRWNLWRLPDGLMHAVAYGWLALLLFGALRAGGRTWWRSAFWSWLVAVLYGITDELHQAFVPGRTPDVKDVGWDAIGAAAAVVAAAVRVLWEVRRRSPDVRS